MSEDRLNLSALHPAEERWDVLAGAIRERAVPELALRSGRAGLIGVLGHWAWPVLAAASLVAAVSGGALALLRPAPDAFGGVIQALQLEEPVSTWLENSGPLTTTDLLIALEEGSR